VPLMRRLALAALMLSVALPIAAASQAVSTPTGTVTDPHGKPLADATLRLVATNGGQTFDTKTNDAGSFQFPDVPAGEYMLSVRYPGFTSRRHRMQLNGGGTTISLQVQVGTLRERVTVGAGTGAVVGQGQVSSAPAPARGACTPSAIGGQITPPMKIRDVRPVYKQELIDAGVEGEVLMQARIGTDGRVTSVDVISPGNAELEDAALAAVSQWRFTPTYLNCEAVEVQMYVTVAFVLPR
jgi:TonB family protein